MRMWTREKSIRRCRQFLSIHKNGEPRLPAWTIPFAYALGAVCLGQILPWLEEAYSIGRISGVSPSAAIAIYSATATGMITLTGIVFSLAFVMVQFSATAYSPRLVLWMSRDPLVSHAIGIFTATFLYAIGALAWVDRNGSGKVPFLNVWIMVALLLGSVGVFVGLIHSLSKLQINSVLAFTGDFARKNIDRMYPPLKPSCSSDFARELASRPVIQTVLYAGSPRAIQSLNTTALVDMAKRVDGTIEMLSSVGDTLAESTPLLRVYGSLKQLTQAEVMSAIRAGTQRTFEQDPKYSVQLLRDIAIRALSTGINDPTTAVQALDQIEDLLLRLGRRCLEIGEVRDESGCLRLIVAVPSWEDFLDLAFAEIRFFGANSVQVMRRLTALMSDLLESLPEPRRPALRRQQRRLETTIAQSFPNLEDRLEASAEDREGLGQTRRRSSCTELTK